MSKYSGDRRFSDLSSEEQSVLVQDVFYKYIESSENGGDGNNSSSTATSTTTTTFTSSASYNALAHQLRRELQEAVLVESARDKEGIR